MSIRVYRLLRNNKEEGPFTAEELVQQNLRPYDLIWIDGRSAAWNYPGELAQFKNYVPLPGEMMDTQNDKVQSVISPSVQAAMAINNNISGTTEKPRYKVSAAWNKIQTVTTAQVNNAKADNEKKPPKKPMVVSHSAGMPSKSLSWEEAWQDWENQKDEVNEMPEPAPAAVSAKKPANNKKEEPVLETKYAEPLESLQDKYIENLLQQKQSGRRSVSAGKVGEFVLPAIALVVIFSAAYWLLNDTEVPALTTATKKQVQTPPVSDTTTSQVPANNNAAKQEEIITEEKQEIPKTITKAPEQAAERKSNKIRLYRAGSQGHVDKEAIATDDNKVSAKIIAPLSKPINTKKAEMPPKVEANNTSANNNSLPGATGSVKTTNNTPVTTNTSINNTTSTSPQPATEENKIKAPLKKVTADYVHAPAYIEMSNGIANIKVENVSNIDFDLVVVDVQYYSASNSFKKGETLYLHNLKAGRNVVIKTPKDASSAYATSKISLISSDAKQLYVVGEN